MKRRIWILLAAAGLIAGSSAILLRADEGEPEHHWRGGFSERMKEKLGLSDDQAAKLKAAFRAQRKTMRPLHDQVRTALERLEDQVEDKASDKDIEASLEQLKAARKALMAEREKFVDSLSQILTPTQRGKAALAIAKRMHRGGYCPLRPRHEEDDGD